MSSELHVILAKLLETLQALKEMQESKNVQVKTQEPSALSKELAIPALVREVIAKEEEPGEEEPIEDIKADIKADVKQEDAKQELKQEEPKQEPKPEESKQEPKPEEPQRYVVDSEGDVLMTDAPAFKRRRVC